MSDVETASSLPDALNSHHRASLHLAPETTLAVTQKATPNGDGRSTLEDVAVNDDAVSVKADSEAETIIQSGREELSPEKKRTYIRHVPGQNEKKESENGIRRAPKFGQPGNWQLGKRKRPDHDNDDSRSALRSNPSSRASSPLPALKQEKTDDPQVLSILQTPLSPRADGATEEKPNDKLKYHRKREGASVDTRDAPGERRRYHHRSASASNGPDGEPDLYPSRHHDNRSPSPPIRSHKRVTSDSIHSPPPPNIQKKRKAPPQPLIDQRYHPSEGRASPFSASSAGSPPPNACARRLASCDTYPFSPIKQMQNKKLRDQNGRTRLARACAAQEVEAAKSRQAERPEDLNVPDNAGNTPLQIAALEGCAEIVKFLIEAGCDIHTKNIDRDTPLIDAVENGHLDVVKILLDAGANPRVGNAKGDEPYDLVPSDNENRNELRRVLADAKSHGNRRRKSDDISGHGTASTKDPRSRGASAASSPDSPPPHTAQSPPPQFGRRKTVRSEATRNDLLWTKPTFENLRGFAAKGDMAGVATILNILQKADTESLIAAAKGGHDEVLGLLLGIGNPDPDPEPLASANHRPGHDTPMLAAIGRGNIDVVKLLLNQPGFDPTRTDPEGRRFFELAQDRKGDNWGMEYNILKEAYDKHVSKYSNRRRIESRSPRRSRDTLKVAKRPDRDSASPASIMRKNPGKSPAPHRQNEDGSKDIKLQKERRSDSTLPTKDRSSLNKGSGREDSQSVADERDNGHTDRKQKIPSDSRSPRESTPHKPGEEPVKRRRLIAGRPPPDHAKRRPSLMSSDSFSGREDASKAGAEDSNENSQRSEKRNSILKRARSSVSPKPTKPRNNDHDEPRDKHVKKRRIHSSELSSHSTSEASKSKTEGDTQSSKPRPAHRDNPDAKSENAKPSDHATSHTDKHHLNSRDATTTKPKHRLSDSGVKAESPSENNTGSKARAEREIEKERVAAAEAERERVEKAKAAKEAKEAEEAKIAAEKAAIIAREKAEEDERKRDEERKQLEEERRQEEERKRKEIEQRRARQAEEEHQRRLEQERLRQIRIRREQEEQEQRRRDALPNRLRTAANLIGANDPRAKSHGFLKKVMPVLHATRDDLEPMCDPELRDEKWILNFYVALLLATNDLQLSQSTSDEYCQLYKETKPKYERMEHVFWVKCSDFMDLVPHIPHLHGLHISLTAMHIDPEPSLAMQQEDSHPSNLEPNHTAQQQPLVNGAPKLNGVHPSS
ncbi:ankyrin repeat protein [Arthroderma uncinatum]|uniref:ankyrin repeat protein n=1 Tax=Arthroderma uncinatum TaxID=74035 RepID=UPI00144A540F|nr:ankyrin repeat protein [Arthroderma uncinatum]KAF3491644.1 ankyrin repeat protein [Arthroderma uncinatum]